MRYFLLTIITLASSLVAVHAQESSHPVDELVLDAHIGWIDGGARFLDSPRTKRRLSREEARVDRGALLDSGIAKAAKEGKLVLWYVPRISEKSKRGVQMYRAPVLDLYMRQVVFCDPSVAAIIESSFVPVRLVCDEALSKRFDVRPLDALEPAIVFLDGEGEVLHYVDHIRTFNARWFEKLLTGVLRQGGAAAPEELPAGGPSFERGLLALERRSFKGPFNQNQPSRGCQGGSSRSRRR